MIYLFAIICFILNYFRMNVLSSLSIVTKAQLDSISVRGDCGGCDVVEEVPGTDIIILVDGSDSYNNKAKVSGSITEGSAYQGTLECIARDFIPGLAAKENTNLGVIQFSGVKQLESSYQPGSGGDTGVNGLAHWKWVIKPTDRIAVPSGFTEDDTLDGNGQIWLCLQDCALPGIMSRSGIFKSGNKKMIVAISDEEWDIRKLNNANGQRTNAAAVQKLVHNAGYEVHSITVRPNRAKDLNEDTILGLVQKSTRYHKVYTDAFETEIKSAFENILNTI